MPDEFKSLEAPITLEKNFLVGGKRVTIQVVFPAALGKDVGMETTLQCAQRVLIRAEGKEVTVKEIKPGT